MRDNLVLIGFMGCGKTSVGRGLSHALHRTMLDTDKWIEEKQGMVVSEIFSTFGEPFFRDLETRCLETLLKTAKRQIISVGGGLPVREENHALLKELGTVIYLKVTPEAVYERLKEDKTRPLLQVEHPAEEIRRLMKKRESVYEACADVIVEVSNLPIEEVIHRITEQLVQEGKEV